MDSEYSVSSIDVLSSPFFACYGLKHLGNVDLRNLFLVLSFRNLGNTEYLTPILKRRIILANLVYGRRLRLLPWLRACAEVDANVNSLLAGLEAADFDCKPSLEGGGSKMPNFESKPI